MKVNKKHNGWIIGLVCVLMLMALMLCACGGDPNGETDPTQQTQDTSGQTETTKATEETVETTEATEATEETTEPTEETTEPTEESTEETTEPTEATTFPTAPPTSSAIGSPGSLGIPTEPTEETTEPTEPTEPVIVPAGDDKNPYCEVIREYPAGFESVSVPGKSMAAYAVFVNNGAELTIESPDAYVIHEGKTYEPVDGVVKLLLTAPKNAPAVFHLGNIAPEENMFLLSIIDALGEPTNPQILEKIDEVKVELEEDDKTGYTFQWTAAEEGTVSFQVAEITENVECDVILTVGEMTVHLVEPEQEEENPEEPEPEETTETEATEAETVAEQPAEEQPTEEQPTEPEKEETDVVSIGVSKDDVLTIQVITLLPEKEEEPVAEEGSTDATEPSQPEEQEEEKLPAANITLKGVFEEGVNPDQEEQTKPTEPEEPTEPSEPEESTEPSEPEESTEPTETTEPTDPTETTESTDPAEPSEPEETTEPTDATEPAVTGYSVTVVDYNGNPKTGVVVQILKDGAAVSMLPVDSDGVAAADLNTGDYAVKLLFSGEELHYEEKAAVLTQTSPHITLKVAPAVSGDPEAINDANAYIVGVGGTYVKTQADVVNYFVFPPTAAGNYKVSASDPEAVLSYWGGNIFFLPSVPYEMEMEDNGYYLNVKESNLGEGQGVNHIIGITGVEDCILEIIRVGDPILGEEDMPYTEYGEGKEIPAYSYSGSGSKRYVDIYDETDSFQLVLNEQDGYYHMNSADGALVYLDLSSNTPYIPLHGIVGVNINADGGENISRSIYEDGVLVRRELFNPLLRKYANSADKTYGIYPLTEELVYMIRHGGDRKGWWDPENINYMFNEYPGINHEIAWMFAVCTMD